MSRNLEIKILMEDGCTRKEAESFLKHGTIIYNVNNSSDITELCYNLCDVLEVDFDIDYMMSRIKNNDIIDIKYISCEYGDYVIEYVN